MALKSVTYEDAYGSTSQTDLVDFSNAQSGIAMSGSSKSTATGLTTHTTVRAGNDTITSYSMAYSDASTDRFLAGRIHMTWDATGRTTLYQYEKGNWESSAFTPDEDGTAVRTSTITGHIGTPGSSSTPANFTSVPSHGTKEVTITAAQGVVREETHVCNGANSYALALTRDHEYEPGGQRRHTGVKINGAYISKTEYVSPTITRGFDQDGSITETQVNASGEVIRTTTMGNVAVPAVTTTYSRTGLTTTTSVNGHVVSIETRDAAGRIVSSEDASGALVTTSYQDGGRTVTRTAPGGVTTVESRHYDGQPVSTTGSGVIARYYNHTVNNSGLFVTTTTVGDVQNNQRVTSVTRNRDGSTASESSPDPAGGTSPVVRTYQYASNSSALLRITSSAANTADQVQLDPSSSAEAAMGHYTLSGYKTGSTGPVIESGDRLTETSISYISSSSAWSRQTVTRVFHTADSDASYTRTTLEALAPVTVSHQDYGGGLRWISTTTNGTTTVTTTRDSFFNASASVLTTDDSATTVSPDSMTVTRHGQTVSSTAYGTNNPETMAYDASGRLARRTSATGATTTYTYNSAGQLEATTDHAGKTTGYTYHPADDAAAGLPWTTTNPEGEVTETLYNNRGQVVETKGNGAYRVTYGYNDYGEKNEMRTYRDANSTGDATWWTHDPATGVLLEKTDANSHTTTYTYYSNGLLHTRLWARSGAITTTYTYNSFGDLTNTDYSDDTPDVTIVPDRIGRPFEITDAAGTRTLAYHSVTGALDLVSHDADGLLASRSIDYTWDSSLRPAGYAVSGGGPTSALTYDDAGRLLTVSSYGGIHTHGYIPGTGTLSGLATTRSGNQVVTRTLYHDRMQRLFGIANTNTAGTLTRHGYTLDGAGRRLHATRENGQRWDYGYDDVGQVTSAVKKFPDATAIPGHTFSYTFDGIGNRTTATQGGTGNGVTYTTNARNQYSNITTEGGRFILGEAPPANAVTINEDTVPATRAGGLGFFWKHIAGDNSSAPLWSLDTITSNNVTLSDRTWTPPNSVTPVHDDDGNLTYDGRWDSVWDAENRLIRMQTTEIAAAAGVPRLRLDFVYDSQGRRVSKTVSTSTNGTTWNFSHNLRFLYDDWNLIAEYSAPSATSTTLTLQAAHLWGFDLSGTPQGAGGVGGLLCSTLQDYENSTTHSCYPAFDGNGNISAWVAENGSLLARMDYSPFGQLIAQHKFTQTGDDTLTRLPFGFSTKYTDKETGLLYYGYRYYDPLTGRWPSRDPIGEKGGLNLYGFVGNDGLNKWDILGKEGVQKHHKVNRCEIYLYIGHSFEASHNDESMQFTWDLPEDGCYRAGALACYPAQNNAQIPEDNLWENLPRHDGPLFPYPNYGTQQPQMDLIVANLGPGPQSDNRYYPAIRAALSPAVTGKMASDLCASPCCCKSVKIRIRIQDASDINSPFEGSSGLGVNMGLGKISLTKNYEWTQTFSCPKSSP
jgi:RHS repeat-associated protein